MVALFAKPVPVISMIFNEGLDLIYEKHSHLIEHWNHNLLSPLKLEEYAASVSAKGIPSDNCFGFVDGIVRPISRPEMNQRLVFNGHKRIHAIKFQSVVTPNGMIANMFGPLGKINCSFTPPPLSHMNISPLYCEFLVNGRNE